MKNGIDISLVAGRRPELLKKTLASYNKGLFRNFKVNNVFANLDPFAGDIKDHAACKAIILDYFPEATINEPETSSFGRAVKWAWSQTQSDYLLHLEDDWILLNQVYPKQLEELFSFDKVKQVMFLCAEKNWAGRDHFIRSHRRLRILGIPLPFYKIPDRWMFTTSPSMLTKDFALGCAKLLQSDLDPEKQLFSGQNIELFNYTQQFENRLLVGKENTNIVKDIGRRWRAERQLSKKIEKGKSIWTKDGQT